MKLKSLIFSLLTLLTLSACSGNGFSKAETNNFTQVDEKGNLSSFNLLTPSEGAVLIDTPTFTWEASDNAFSYALEISTTPQFYNDIETEVYYRQPNITSTSFTIQSSLNKKNVIYYWKVTASNKAHSLECSQVGTFFLQSDDKDEVKIDIGYADDWKLHEIGSYADISINNSNFFGNDEPSLVISFTKENTNRGVITSDGWAIVTKTVEKDIYGTDSILFDFYYAGNDARVLLRLVDNDNEYWYCPVQISNNSKQSVILKFSDFIQRTADVTVANHTFNYEHIKYMEIVFEKTFGDGVCLISNIRAVKFNNYSNMFIDTLHFDQYSDEAFTTENFNFARSINGDEMIMSYTSSINGYGFVKVNANQYFVNGDSIQFSVKYSGGKGTNVLFRIYEQDTDRWSYKLPFSNLTENEYYNVVVPYQAFAKSSINGDGYRQFYFILNLQFGLEGCYSAGSLSFKDVKVVYKKDVTDTSIIEVGESGIIDDFDNYNHNAELFYKWNVSDSNKDEMMSINTQKKVGGATNKQCVQLEYKSDMEPAIYTLPVNIMTNDVNAISIWLKDGSIKATSASYSHLKNASPETAVVITLKSGEEYRFMIEALDAIWNEYVIPYSEFVLANGESINGTPQTITTEGIGYITIAMQYTYYTKDGKPSPAYSQNNPVYVDNIKMASASSLSKTPKERTIIPSTDDSNIALIDDMELYNNSLDIFDYWMYGNTQTYNLLELSNDVSSIGGTHSLNMQYKGNSNSVSYAYMTSIDSSISAKALTFDIKGDNKATVYINIYLTISGSTTQFRATLSNVSSSWSTYKIGFDNFENISSSSGLKINKNNVMYIEKITIGIVNYSDNNLSNIYLDNLMFNGSLSYSVNSVTPII